MQTFFRVLSSLAFPVVIWQQPVINWCLESQRLYNLIIASKMCLKFSISFAFGNKLPKWFHNVVDLETARIEYQWGLHLRLENLCWLQLYLRALSSTLNLLPLSCFFSCDIKILQISNYRHCFRGCVDKNVADISVKEGVPCRTSLVVLTIGNLPTTSGHTDLIWSRKDPTCCGSLPGPGSNVCLILI